MRTRGRWSRCWDRISKLMKLFQALAEYHGIAFMETSAKLGTNVEEAFTVISEEIYNKLETGEYKVEEGWDGIKAGHFQRPDRRGMLEAQPARSNCC